MAVMKTTLQRSQVGQKLFLNEMLQRLRPKKQPRRTREKVKVDQGDLVMDVYRFFESPDFDLTIGWKLSSALPKRHFVRRETIDRLHS